mmetsp:Transcript_3920/g.3680  ORF Transcript_3920/g.3680 Transcript_3920/m.3680 type:complete len:110 (-) Transcript_3920:27-356(-)|eukprot:CAMPEP_0197010384 /NCGR_PEP_ID=MMETSP1380-20130617/54069_1 /TAXON_ID=5936 /ORGANISM="Euplotes crassus, Strain CT5" /LENGTH=109 /DNA_ID=CAMNT_0042432267 /DNA_START=1009 /DNA_END=1338 /DNA_ORIENTATION=-
MYDITNAKSLETCQYWKDSEKLDDKTIYLVGTKADLEDQREVSREYITQFQIKNEIDFHFETSAKTGQGVEELLQHLMEYYCQEESPSTKNDESSTSNSKGLLRRIFRL